MADEKLGDWSEKASAIMLLSAAVLGLIYEAAHIFGGEELVKHLGSGEGPLIFLIALLCGGLGLERWFILRKVRASIGEAGEHVRTILDTVVKIEAEVTKDFKTVEEKEAELKKLLTEMSTVEPLIGATDIAAAAIEIINACANSDVINATSQYSSEDLLSPEYVTVMANRVERAEKEGGGLECRVVRPARTGPEGEAEDERSRVFREKHIEDRLTTKRSRHPWPMEVLIVGKAMIIALRGGRQRPTYEVAVKITDPDFVKIAADWYNQAVWGEADEDPQSDGIEKPHDR